MMIERDEMIEEMIEIVAQGVNKALTELEKSKAKPSGKTDLKKIFPIRGESVMSLAYIKWLECRDGRPLYSFAREIVETHLAIENGSLIPDQADQ